MMFAVSTFLVFFCCLAVCGTIGTSLLSQNIWRRIRTTNVDPMYWDYIFSGSQTWMCEVVESLLLLFEKEKFNNMLHFSRKSRDGKDDDAAHTSLTRTPTNKTSLSRSASNPHRRSLNFFSRKSKDGEDASHSSSTTTPTSTSTSSPRHSYIDNNKNGNPTRQQPIPLHTLPTELLHQITSYLHPYSYASLSLTSFHMCQKLGRLTLSTYLSTPFSKTLPPCKLDKRRKIELLERAFPSHWFCAWCDRFHEAQRNGGPKHFERESKRECAEWNSYLHGGGKEGKNIVIAFHHVRLAIHRAVWGSDFGISMSEFDFKEEGEIRVVKNGRTIPTMLTAEAKVLDGRMYLHSSFGAKVPREELCRRGAQEKVFRGLPQIVGGHRNDEEGHTGLKMAVYHALGMNRTEQAMLCSTCATDWLVEADFVVPEAAGVTRGTTPDVLVSLRVQSWRDLGTGRTPFDNAWRAHGEIGKSAPGFAGDVVRLTGYTRGQIRKVFEGDSHQGPASGRDEHGLIKIRRL